MAIATKLISAYAFAACVGLHKTLADLLIEINQMREVEWHAGDKARKLVVLNGDNPGELVLLTKRSVIDGLQELIAEHSSIATMREVLEDENAVPFAGAYDDGDIRAADEDEDEDEDDDEDLDDDEDEDLDDDEDDDVPDDDDDDDDEEEDDDEDLDDDWEEVDDDEDDEEDDDDDEDFDDEDEDDE